MMMMMMMMTEPKTEVTGSRALKPNTHRRRDATVGLSRVGGVYGIRN